MGSLVAGMCVIAIVMIIIFTCVATVANPFIGFGAFITLFLLIIGALVSWLGPAVASVVAAVIVLLSVVVTPLGVFLMETFVWGEVKKTHKNHVSIGQTDPYLVARETHDPDNDSYDFSRLTSRYEDDHH